VLCETGFFVPCNEKQQCFDSMLNVMQRNVKINISLMIRTQLPSLGSVVATSEFTLKEHIELMYYESVSLVLQQKLI